MQVLCKWLQKAYKVDRYGEPTWKMLSEAAASRAGGDNPALAEEIAKRHLCTSKLP